MDEWINTGWGECKTIYCTNTVFSVTRPSFHLFFRELLQDLRRNIKYPDEETAKDLDTLDEASSNFGVRNIVNYLGLLDGYFEELHGQLDEQWLPSHGLTVVNKTFNETNREKK